MKASWQWWCFVLIVSSCGPNGVPTTTPTSVPLVPDFRYTLQLFNSSDLDRAFAAGHPIDTLGLKLKDAETPSELHELSGVRDYVELISRPNANTSVHMLLSRGETVEDERKSFGEVFMVLKNMKGEVTSAVLIDRFECSEDTKRTLSLGWVERAVFCQGATRARRIGVGHTLITYVNRTTSAWLDPVSIRASRDWIATSDVLEGKRALVQMCSFD